MPKPAKVFFCSECGYESSKWLGQCPGCRAWNTFVEEPVKKAGPAAGIQKQRIRTGSKATPLSAVSLSDHDRVSSGMEELDRVLGGGIVPGSLILVGGDPGIGKSTILLQVSRYLAGNGSRVLYVSGEESLQQIKMRAVRLSGAGGDVMMASETNLDDILQLIETEKPDTVIVDSIQTVFREDVSSSPGSVSQVRECANVLMQTAKSGRITIFLVGHVTKEGTVAGPRVLEHMVDTVLYFEGDRSASYRIIRAVKNRFGATNEVGVFEMAGDGLHEVANPSSFMLEGRPEGASGSAVTAVMEGTRPLLLELQALVARTNFGLPRRTAVGIDQNRLNLLIAVLEKRAGLSLGEYDVYVNITGGMRIQDPSVDLAVVSSIVSGYYDRPLRQDAASFGEVGLTGEIRGVSQVSQRVREAVKLGYEVCFVPAVSMRSLDQSLRAHCVPVSTVSDAITKMFGARRAERQ